MSVLCFMKAASGSVFVNAVCANNPSALFCDVIYMICSKRIIKTICNITNICGLRLSQPFLLCTFNLISVVLIVIYCLALFRKEHLLCWFSVSEVERGSVACVTAWLWVVLFVYTCFTCGAVSMCLLCGHVVYMLPCKYFIVGLVLSTKRHRFVLFFRIY